MKFVKQERFSNQFTIHDNNDYKTVKTQIAFFFLLRQKYSGNLNNTTKQRPHSGLNIEPCAFCATMCAIL
jgi:hypothetical protein